MQILRSKREIEMMRKAGLVVWHALQVAKSRLRVGVTTAEIDAAVEEFFASQRAEPLFKGVPGRVPFPAVTCISVNEEVVHGIPGPRELVAGDLVSVDFGAIVDGFHGDAAITFGVGELSEADQRLSDVTLESLWAGIAAAHLGGRVTDISHAIEKSIRARRERYGILKDYTGHGIGSEMHQAPYVPNVGRPGRGPRIVEGLALAVEPMVTLGSAVGVTLDDEWTVVTKDGSRACHWEHTITVTPKGLWVLTAEDGGEAELSARGVPFGPLGD